ncbi:viperin family antiviral radical SAM protein [Bradymonas sediminis]|nr:viperin family antiviral radical SAM protein [Bradymonas sediminis]TDP63605.1 radical S-adenosyl methionine domain-containing protein 2 [Bradymonas sediminis]
MKNNVRGPINSDAQITPLEKASTKATTMPPSINYHLNKACNYSCKFCYARFEDSAEYLGRGMLPKAQQLEVVRQIAAAGFEKITFAGGEPTLVPWLAELVATAKDAGMTTMVVSNGSRLDAAAFDAFGGKLDWLVISIDSADDGTHLAIGRAQKGKTQSAAKYRATADLARHHGIRLKMNTVVNRLNVDEDMSELIAQMAPERWKLFQVLPIDGQNDGYVEELEITRAEFDAFVARHRGLADAGIVVVSESNEAMTGSYAMVDPAGRFFDNTMGAHTYSRPILEVGIREAFSQVSFDLETFKARGGEYDW